MKQNIVETIIGFIILIIAGILLTYVNMHNNKKNDKKGYVLYSECSNAEGVLVGSDVMISGVKVGQVIDLKIDPQSFYALITLKINSNIQLPEDSFGDISTNGLLGSKYIALIPGTEEAILKPGGSIRVSPAINLESLVDKVMFFLTNKKEE